MPILKVNDSPPHEFQDEKYGLKMRVCNKSKSKPDTYYDTTTGKAVNHRTSVSEEPKKKK